MKEQNVELYKKVGLRIKEMRLQKNMSQADLSELSTVSLPHISDIENGKTEMKLATFSKLAEALQVSADSLLRPDIPTVNNIYQNEFSEILSDCSPDEIDSLINIVKEVKQTMHSKKNIYDD